MILTGVQIPDSHIPYHDRRAYKLLLKVLKYLEPDEILFGGDFADFYCIHQHGGKDPRTMRLLKEEVDEVNKVLDVFDKEFPKSKKVYLEGNHENRLERFLVSKAPELFGLTSTKNLFKFDQRPNWKFIPYTPNQKYSVLGSKLRAKHVPPRSNASRSLTSAMSSLIFFHTHRIEEASATDIDGNQMVCYSVGWLGDSSYDEVYGYVKGHYQWQLGFGIVRYDTETKEFHHVKIRISKDYTCIVDGKLFK